MSNKSPMDCQINEVLDFSPPKPPQSLAKLKCRICKLSPYLEQFVKLGQMIGYTENKYTSDSNIVFDVDVFWRMNTERGIEVQKFRYTWFRGQITRKRASRIIQELRNEVIS